MRLSLPDVTLCLLNGNGQESGERIIRWLCSWIEFGEVFHLSPLKPSKPHNGEWVQLPEMSHKDAMCIQTKTMGAFLRTGYMLNIEPDGFPLHPERWSDDFFSWDYVGAPWGPGIFNSHVGRVGNGGCTLRSRKFIDAVKGLEYPKGFEWGDQWWTRIPHVHKAVVDAGCKYAPIDVAIRFAYEGPVPEFPVWLHEWSFGFHCSQRHNKSGFLQAQLARM